MLDVADVMFYVLASLTFIGALGVIFARNPIFSALWLAVTMVMMAFLFITLDAAFIAGVQLIVYAGAVMVLFVMVLMLFDLKHEMKTFSPGLVGNGLKIASAGAILGALGASFMTSAVSVGGSLGTDEVKATGDLSKALAMKLFREYLFSFEAIGALLLIIAIGAVALSRISGGTHAD